MDHKEQTKSVAIILKADIPVISFRGEFLKIEKFFQKNASIFPVATYYR